MTRTEPMISRTDAPIDALVLAGRRGEETDPLHAVDGVPHKALLLAGGKPLIRRVLEALFASRRIETVCIAAPADVRDAITLALTGLDGWSFSDAKGSPASTIAAAIEQLNAGRALLVTTCDHALLSADMIRRFLDGARKADAAAAAVERTIYEARFPDSRRTFIRLQDVSFSGANLFWFSGPRAKGLADFWRRLERKRKNPAAMALEIGLVPALSYLTGMMTKHRLEKTIRQRTKVDARLVLLPIAEAAIDVDKPEDLVLVRNILAVD